MDIKETAKQAGKGLLFLSVIYVVLWMIQPPLWGTWLIFVGFILILKLYTKTFKLWKFLLQSVLVFALLLLFQYAISYGAIGILLFSLTYCTYILIRRRKRLVEAKHHIESMVWGKPIKEFTSQGEKPPKLKFTLKKDKN